MSEVILSELVSHVHSSQVTFLTLKLILEFSDVYLKVLLCYWIDVQVKNLKVTEWNGTASIYWDRSHVPVNCQVSYEINVNEEKLGEVNEKNWYEYESVACMKYDITVTPKTKDGYRGKSSTVSYTTMTCKYPHC